MDTIKPTTPDAANLRFVLHRDCSARPLIVTQDLVNEIIRRAKDSRWGLDNAKCETSLAHYTNEDAHTLAMVLVTGWEAKYDLVSLFAAAIEVVNEKAQNADVSDRRDNHKR